MRGLQLIHVSRRVCFKSGLKVGRSPRSHWEDDDSQKRPQNHLFSVHARFSKLWDLKRFKQLNFFSDRREVVSSDNTVVGSQFYLYDLNQHRFISVYDGFSVGRTEANENFPTDSLMSRTHFRLSIAGSVISIEDLRSTNKTRVSGVELAANSKRFLREYETVEAGNQRFVLCTQNKVAPMVLSSGNLAVVGQSITAPEDSLLQGGRASAPIPGTPAPREDAGAAAARLTTLEFNSSNDIGGVELDGAAVGAPFESTSMGKSAPGLAQTPRTPHSSDRNSLGPAQTWRRPQVQVAGAGVKRSAVLSPNSSSPTVTSRNQGTGVDQREPNWKSLAFYRDELIEFRKIKEWPRKTLICVLASLALPVYLFDHYQTEGAFEPNLIYDVEQLYTTLGLAAAITAFLGTFFGYLALKYWSKDAIAKELVVLFVVGGLGGSVLYTAIEDDWVAKVNQNSLVYHCGSPSHRAHCRAQLAQQGRASFQALPPAYRKRIEGMLGDQLPFTDSPAARAARRIPANRPVSKEK